jgi:hypothetical protein
MIQVVGRPGLDEQDRLGRLAGRVALAAAQAGARVELVGTVGDDADGERVALALGQAGIGHAALLRDPAGVTPREGGPGGRLPRLEAADVELGLNYLVECRALVLAEVPDDEVLAVARGAAAYHSAHLILLLEAGRKAPNEVLPQTTVMEVPADDEGAFAELVGRYAAGLAVGEDSARAWESAVRSVGWERSAYGSPGDLPVATE